MLFASPLLVLDGNKDKSSIELGAPWDDGGLDGDATGTVIDVTTANTVSVTGLTITGGDAGDPGGGGVRCGEGSTLSVADTTLTGNSTTWYGGGLLAYSCDATVTGGAITDNVGAYGAGVAFIGEAGSVRLVGVTASGNTASFCGGFANVAVTPGHRFTIEDSVIVENSAPRGGALQIYSGDVSCTGSGAGLMVVERNTATEYGGGVALEYGGSNPEPLFSAANCDFGSDADDNLPEDVSIDGQAYPYGDASTFECSVPDGCLRTTHDTCVDR